MFQTGKESSLEVEREATRDISYDRYRELGGIINEGDYTRALTRAVQTTHLRETLVAQAELIARVAGFPLNNSNGHLDEITILYGVLRTDSKPGAEYHHGQMCDQRLFAEALRMMDRPDLLAKVIEAHPNIFL